MYHCQINQRNRNELRREVIPREGFRCFACRPMVHDATMQQRWPLTRTGQVSISGGVASAGAAAGLSYVVLSIWRGAWLTVSVWRKSLEVSFSIWCGSPPGLVLSSSSRREGPVGAYTAGPATRKQLAGRPPVRGASRSCLCAALLAALRAPLVRVCERGLDGDLEQLLLLLACKVARGRERPHGLVRRLAPGRGPLRQLWRRAVHGAVRRAVCRAVRLRTLPLARAAPLR